MKHLVLATMALALANLAPAETPSGAAAPAPDVAAATPPRVSITGDAATNASGKPDMAKIQALYAEMGSISKELRQQEKAVQESDPEIKALMEKRDAAQQALMAIETQRRELMDAKLATDPKLAPPGGPASRVDADPERAPPCARRDASSRRCAA